MPLSESEVIVTTKYGRMPAFTAAPAAPGSYPAVIFYMDAPGYREELRMMARRIAKAGYFCVLPDLYYRYGTVRFDTPRRDDAMSAVIKAAFTNLTTADVIDDTAGLLAFIDGQDNAKTGPVGCVGFCMSGCMAMTAAAVYPDRIKAAASLYGLGLVTDKPESPHRMAAKIKAELYFGFAEVDPAVPENVIPELKPALDKAGVTHNIEVFPGTRHGFCFPERAVYAPVAAERAWERLFDLWARNLN
jgi:carboxymethylenebutenolidase